ncbi:MAG: hypothetical protein REJ50_03190 [Bordetella sp.]|uniref:hypothetical protein n=1 Tax=Bordetella genomosp. 1 TaxID=1395607 RepID=UPI0015C60F6E|nr:hypothetical protein [Bordetella genomosp. 1]MDQ8030995.1 hypothetical protein [Bordetella sp.]
MSGQGIHSALKYRRDIDGLRAISVARRPSMGVASRRVDIRHAEACAARVIMERSR